MSMTNQTPQNLTFNDFSPRTDKTMDDWHQTEREVAGHYTHGQLAESLWRALADALADPDNLRPEDLTAVEEFHIGGRAATVALAELLDLPSAARVLDVGSGIGGTARYLALERGWSVDGIDLTQEYCDVANELSARLGIADQTRFVQGSALDLPFEADTFDAATMLHVGMNIEDKRTLFEQVRRVLRPGGRFAIYDVMDGGGGPPLFPVPWARSAETSFLVEPEAAITWLEEVGFDVVLQKDCREMGVAFFEKMAALQAAGNAPKVGLPVLMGKGGPERLGNVKTSLLEGRISPWQIIARKQ